MAKAVRHFLWIAFMAVLFSGAVAYGQYYYFAMPIEVVDVFIDPDCSLVIQYQFTFSNDTFADPIDVVDVGFPSDDYHLDSCEAWIDGEQLYDIRVSEYIDIGIEVHLSGSQQIMPGETKTLTVMGRNYNMVYGDESDQNYASVVFGNTWFGSDFAHGTTDLTVHIHFPPGLTSEEPRYHTGEDMSPPTSMGFLDDRVVYTWHNPSANPYTQYFFGVSLPRAYMTGAISSPPSGFEKFIGGLLGLIFSILPCLIPFGIIGTIIFISVVASRTRKMKYMPAKASIEGVGIKRGLTAPEAALVLELPLNKILTMIMFGLLKKRSLSVKSEDPLKLKKLSIPPHAKPREYEVDFMEAITKKGNLSEVRLRKVLINMIKNVNKRMKGFSRRETIEYYQSIVKKAWETVKSADTPELAMARWEDNVEWTIMDDDFEENTRTIFVGRTVYAPGWWPGTVGGGRVGAGGGKITVPSLPGSSFAAGVIGKMQNFSKNIVGSVTGFTGGVTAKTNPPPVSSYKGGGGRSSGGGSSCACACACAGCACACAGGGR